MPFPPVYPLEPNIFNLKFKIMSDDVIYLLIGLYALSCIIIATESKKRGWDAVNVFVICAITSPLIGAILYSPYKKEDIIKNNSIETKEVSDKQNRLLEIIAKSNLANYRQIILTDKTTGVMRTTTVDELIDYYNSDKYKIELAK